MQPLSLIGLHCRSMLLICEQLLLSELHSATHIALSMPCVLSTIVVSLVVRLSNVCDRAGAFFRTSLIVVLSMFSTAVAALLLSSGQRGYLLSSGQ